MDDIKETPKGPIKFELPKVTEMKGEFSSLKDVWSDFVDKIKDFADSITGKNKDTEADTTPDSKDTSSDVPDASDYCVEECADVAKECFPPEVIEAWGTMDIEQRDAIIKEYADGIGEALDVDFKGVLWELMPDDGGYTFGYNCGDGYIHLNVDMIADPGKLMYLIDTVAHELRHQMQNEAIDNPGKYPIDDATIREWTVARDNYTMEMPSAYDPWGYTYNPMETDARHFGESMVRELTKDLINNNA